MTHPRRSSGGGAHCELTSPGTHGRREMSTFGDTSPQVQFFSETRRHSRPHTSSAVVNGQVLDTAARACLYRTRHRKTRRRGPGQRRYPRTGAPRPRAAEAAAQRLRRDSRAADRRAKRQRRCCCCSAPTTLRHNLGDIHHTPQDNRARPMASAPCRLDFQTNECGRTNQTCAQARNRA